MDHLSRTSKSHTLNVAYISLDLSREKTGSNPSGHAFDDYESGSSVQTAETLLAESKRIVVRGDAGAGKTTLVRWIAVAAAARKFDSSLDGWNDSIPFVIRLRRFGDNRFPSPESFPALVAPQIAGTMPDGWVHNHLKAGTAAVMIDGVDEVSEDRRYEAREWVRGLTQAFPDARFIVTSRPHAVGENWLAEEQFLDADLQPMDVASVDDFVDHWHESVAKEVNDEDGVVKLLSLATDLKALLRTNQAVRRLATNPLLCAVICALHRDTNKQVPDDRLELYELLFDAVGKAGPRKWHCRSSISSADIP